MEQSLDPWFILGILAYAVAATAYYLQLSNRAEGWVGPRWAPRALLLALLLHLLQLTMRSVASRTCPVIVTAFAPSLTGWLLVGVYLLVARRLRTAALGVLVAPLGLSGLVATEFLRAPGAISPVPSWLLAIHVSANLLGVGLFLLAAVAAILYLVQSRRLKLKRASSHLGLPPLSTLQVLVRRLLVLGLAPLTLGVVSGAVFAHREFVGETSLLRIALAYTTWLTVGGLSILARFRPTSGRKVAWGAIVGASLGLLVVVLYALSGMLGGSS